MKITDVEAVILRLPNLDDIACDGTQDALIVRIHTDEGITGVGEADSSPYVCKTIIEAPPSHAIARGLKHVLIGQDPFDVEMLWQRMYEASIYYGRRGAAIHAISGVDIALWDIIGKATGRPVAQMLGGAYRDRVRVYASTLMPERPDEVAARVRPLVEQGYTAVKLGWGPLGRNLDLDVALVRAAREAVGPRVDLMIDIGLMYDAATAVRMVRLFEPFNLFWLEEPLPPDDLAGYARLADAVDTRIAAGEEDATIYGFRDLVERGRVDVIQPDIARCGGFTEARKIGHLAAEHNLLCVPHAFSTGILVSASLHFAATLRRGNLAEFSVQESPFVRDLLRAPFRLEADGTVRVPTGPGLGIELDEDMLERYRYHS